jgi:antitoxin VapB
MSTALQQKKKENHEFAPNGSRGTSLNIKNAETTRLVRELAALKGVSLVVAVTEAVHEKLEREKAERSLTGKTKKSRSELLMEFAEQCAPFFKDGRSGNDLINDLYDEETGLPK